MVLYGDFDINMKKRNIVYIDSDDYYKNQLKLSKASENFYISKVDNISNLERKQGFLLLLTMDDLYPYFSNVVDIFEPDVYEIDRYVRKLFKNFEYVIILSIEEFDYGHIPFSNIYVESADKYFGAERGINLLVDKLYKEYISKKDTKYSRIRMNNINRLKMYIKNKEFITTKEIMNDLGVNEKWIQRYMKDMNIIYKNIGYNKKKRVWYVVKNNCKI